MSSIYKYIFGSSIPERKVTPCTEFQHLCAGSAAGVLVTIMLHPLDAVKVRSQVYCKTGPLFPSTFAGLCDIVNKEGFRALYAGVTPAAMGAAISWGGYFYLYENMKNQMQSPSARNRGDKQNFFLPALLAGSAMAFLTNPLWLVKNRLQMQGGPFYSPEFPNVAASYNNSTRYKGPIDATTVILRLEGVRGLFKGSMLGLALASQGATQITIYENITRVFSENSQYRQQSPQLSIAAGALSQVAATTFFYPIQVIRARVQKRGDLLSEMLSTPKFSYEGVIDCVSKTMRQEGFMAMFRGFAPHCCRMVPQSALFFLTYEEVLKQFFKLQN